MPNDLFGVFIEETGLAAGDPYKPLADVGKGRLGKQMVVSAPKTGKTPDALLDKNLKLSTPGEKYTDAYRIQAYMEKRQGNPISSKPFVPSSPTRKPTGAGSPFGTFSTILDTDASVGARSGKVASTEAGKKRNFTINPPKKGGFGFPYQDNTIGGTKLVHMPDEYCRGRILDKELAREARSKFTKAFVSTTRPHDWREDKGIYQAGPGGERKPSTARSSSTGPQWRPSNPASKGRGFGTISRIPYVPNPTRETKFHAKDDASAKPFKPCGDVKKRLSMWAPNPYSYEAIPSSWTDNDVSLL